jgi:hypothetical protein
LGYNTPPASAKERRSHGREKKKIEINKEKWTPLSKRNQKHSTRSNSRFVNTKRVPASEMIRSKKPGESTKPLSAPPRRQSATRLRKEKIRALMATVVSKDSIDVSVPLPNSTGADEADAVARDLQAMGYDLDCRSFLTTADTKDSAERYNASLSNARRRKRMDITFSADEGNESLDGRIPHQSTEQKLIKEQPSNSNTASPFTASVLSKNLSGLDLTAKKTNHSQFLTKKEPDWNVPSPITRGQEAAPSQNLDLSEALLQTEASFASPKLSCELKKTDAGTHQLAVDMTPCRSTFQRLKNRLSKAGSEATSDLSSHGSQHGTVFSNSIETNTSSKLREPSSKKAKVKKSISIGKFPLRKCSLMPRSQKANTTDCSCVPKTTVYSSVTIPPTEKVLPLKKRCSGNCSQSAKMEPKHCLVKSSEEPPVPTTHLSPEKDPESLYAASPSMSTLPLLSGLAGPKEILQMPHPDSRSFDMHELLSLDDTLYEVARLDLQSPAEQCNPSKKFRIIKRLIDGRKGVLSVHKPVELEQEVQPPRRLMGEKLKKRLTSVAKAKHILGFFKKRLTTSDESICLAKCTEIAGHEIFPASESVSIPKAPDLLMSEEHQKLQGEPIPSTGSVSGGLTQRVYDNKCPSKHDQLGFSSDNSGFPHVTECIGEVIEAYLKIENGEKVVLPSPKPTTSLSKVVGERKRGGCGFEISSSNVANSAKGDASDHAEDCALEQLVHLKSANCIASKRRECEDSEPRPLGNGPKDSELLPSVPPTSLGGSISGMETSEHLSRYPIEYCDDNRATISNAQRLPAIQESYSPETDKTAVSKERPPITPHTLKERKRWNRSHKDKSPMTGRKSTQPQSPNDRSSIPLNLGEATKGVHSEPSNVLRRNLSKLSRKSSISRQSGKVGSHNNSESRMGNPKNMISASTLVVDSPKKQITTKKSRTTSKEGEMDWLDDLDQQLDAALSALSLDSSLGDVETAIKTLKKHAKRLGVSENDLLLAVKSEDTSFPTIYSGQDGESVRTLTFGEEMLYAVTNLFETGRSSQAKTKSM